jgi:GT2 family glycosyltransferase/2-polyprenyl-3-methyl-5-hydroxy-6-metoxy-1,4-benzoquinol methylase
MTSADAAFRYDRSADLEGEDSLSAIARLIGPGATVLDLGAATGKLGLYLRDHKKCIVDGVELDPKAAEQARPHYRKLLEVNLEEVRLADHFPRGSYDAIVCADVLEHLRDPGRILDQLPELLSSNGRALLSIPNVAYAGVVAGLLSGEFRYGPTGLLDETHLRFFTRSSIAELLAKHGFRAASMQPLYLPLQNSEFRQHLLEALPPPVLRALVAQPDALAYQFIVEAVPGAGPAPQAEAIPPGPRFAVQLYWATQGKLDEANSAIASGVMGEEFQQVELRIPMVSAAPTALRLDISDRPGYVRLRTLALHDPNGVVLWAWDGDIASLRDPRQVHVLASGPLAGTLLCTGEDPSVELPVPPEALARLGGGGFLRADMGWPLSSDSAFAAQMIDARERQWQTERSTLLTLLDSLRREMQLRYGNAERIEQTLASAHANQRMLAHHLERLSSRLQALERGSLVRRVLGRARRELLPPVFHFDLEPSGRLRDAGSGDWIADDEDPHFQLRPRSSRLPAGWVLFEADLRLAEPGRLPPQLYVDEGLGFNEASAIRLPRPEGGELRVEVRLPANTVALRLDPTDREGQFHLSGVTMRELGQFRAGLRLAAPIADELMKRPEKIPAAARKFWSIFRERGVRGLKGALVERSRDIRPVRYAAWVEEFDTLDEADRAAIAARIAAMTSRSRISVLMPVFNTPEDWLRRAIESVRGQLYPDWELCIADDASTRPHVRRVLESAAASDARIKVTFREVNGHISAASNTALEAATGDYVALLDHDDELAPHALYMLAEEIAEHRDADVIYSDEDKIDGAGERYEPYFKPEWNPDLFDSQNYLGHLSCVRSSLVREVGGFRTGFDGSQDYDLLLRLTSRSSAARIRHVPHVLYHWRSVRGSTAAANTNKRYAVEAALKALRDRHPGCAVSEGPFPTTYRVAHPLPERPPLVTLIIPTRDGFALLERAVRSIQQHTTYPRFEILILDNQSTDPRSLQYLKELQASGQARVIKYDAPFNFSAINNFGAREARGEILGLVNNDIEVINPDWLSEMVSQAIRPEIGAVGCKLLYPDDTIQHAGVVLGLFGVAGHVFKKLPRDAPGYFARAQLTQDLSGCTAACLVLRKSIYEEVGGFDEQNLRIAFNDVDFCMKIARAGYRNLYTPHAALYHHESASRGYEDTPEKQVRFRGEIEFMKKKWGAALEEDPAYSPNLSLESLQMEIAWPPRAPRPWKPE